MDDFLDQHLAQHMVRVGIVHDVNNEKHLARVKYPDLNYISAWLPVLQTPPFIPDYDVPQRTEYEAGGSGEAAFENHKHDLVIKPWMPKVNDKVVTIHIPVHNGDGFVLGGL